RLSQPHTTASLFPYSTLFRSFGASLAHKLLLARSSQAFLDYSLPEAQEAEEDLMQAYVSVQRPPAIFRDYEQPMKVVPLAADREDRKSTRLNSSHVKISYAVF